MPDAIKPTFDRLSYDLRSLQFKWIALKNLFGHSDERVGLLNATARVFFAGVQRIMTDDIILGIARLTDSPRSCGRDNLTLSRLHDQISSVCGSALVESLKTEVEEAEKVAARVREYRHKRLAHRDLAVALEEALPPELKYGDLKASLDQCAKVLNTVQEHFGGGTTGYADGIVSPEGTQALVNALKRAAMCSEMIETGEVSLDRSKNYRFDSA